MAGTSFRASKKQAVTPFWQRLSLFFRYPFYSGPLIYIGSLSLLCSLLGIGLGLSGLIIILLVVGFLFFRLALRVMEQTAVGRLHPDQYMLTTSEDSAPGVFGLLAIQIVWGFFLGLNTHFFGLFGNFLGSVLYSVLLPACIMVYVVTGSVLRALNPAQFLHVVATIGMPYFGLSGLLFMLTLSFPQAVKLVGGILSGSQFLAIFVVAFLFMYFYLIMFNMMGYVLYQYHRDLGYDADIDFEDADDGTGAHEKAHQPSADEVLDERVADLISEDELEEAINIAYEAQRLNPENPKAIDRYFKLLVLADKTEKALSYGRRAIRTLLENERFEAAYNLYKECQKLGDFVAEDGHQAFGLAQGAKMKKDIDGAVALIRGFDKKYPGNADIPAVYLFSAEILVDAYREDEKALKILQVLIERYPHHPLREEAERRQNVLKKFVEKAS